MAFFLPFQQFKRENPLNRHNRLSNYGKSKKFWRPCDVIMKIPDLFFVFLAFLLFFLFLSLLLVNGCSVHKGNFLFPFCDKKKKEHELIKGLKIWNPIFFLPSILPKISISVIASKMDNCLSLVIFELQWIN